MDDAPPVCEVIERWYAVDDRFKVALHVDGQVHEVAPLRTEEEAAVVCDAVAVHRAVVAGLPVEAAQFRFLDGMPEVRDALLQAYRSGALAGGGSQHDPLLAVLRQLADCAATTTASPFGAPPPHAAAVRLLGAAVGGAHDAALWALLIVNPSAALVEVWGSAGPHLSGLHWGSLLHLAAKCGNSTATKALLAAAPSMAAKQDERGCLPLHEAATNDHTAVVQQLLDAAPQAALVANGCGWLPLHVAAENDYAVMAQHLLDAAPQAALVASQHGWLPLHVAVDRYNKAVAQQLLDAAPQAALVANAQGMLPLHLAALYEHAAVVQPLLDAAPQAALVAATDGWLPLHLAVEHEHTAMVQQLLDAAPQAALVARRDSLLPLHLAAENGHTAMVQQLLDAAPQAALVASQHGVLPLHIAAENDDAAVAQLLLDAAPQAAAVENRGGHLPLDLTLVHGDDTACLLIRAAAAPRQRDLSFILSCGPDHHYLLPMFVAARVPLSAAEWQQIPAPCPGSLYALPAALSCSADQAQEVARRLSLDDAAWLRAALQWLHVSQRRSRVFLPSGVVHCILIHSIGILAWW